MKKEAAVNIILGIMSPPAPTAPSAQFEFPRYAVDHRAEEHVCQTRVSEDRSLFGVGTRSLKGGTPRLLDRSG
jgi:hypothetical protein